MNKQALEEEISDLTRRLNLATSELIKLNRKTWNFCEEAPGKVIIERYSHEDDPILEDALTVIFDKEDKSINFITQNQYDQIHFSIDGEMTENLINFLKSQLYKFDNI